MGKIILLALGLLLVYWILRAYRRRVSRASAPSAPAAGEDMVQCAQCGVHLPRSESIAAPGAHYCSVEHQRAHRPQQRSG